jgi:hypothetical protein
MRHFPPTGLRNAGFPVDIAVLWSRTHMNEKPIINEIPTAELHALARQKMGLELSTIPPLLTAEQVGERILALGRTSLYSAASAGEIETASVGAPGHRGRRFFLTTSVISYVLRRMGSTVTPKVTPRSSRSRHKADVSASRSGGGDGAAAAGLHRE